MANELSYSSEDKYFRIDEKFIENGNIEVIYYYSTMIFGGKFHTIYTYNPIGELLSYKNSMGVEILKNPPVKVISKPKLLQI